MNNSKNNSKLQKWQKLYHAALFEQDAQKVHDLVEAAEAEIFLRGQALQASPDGNAERLEIEEAVEALRIIKREKLNYPDWQREFRNPVTRGLC